MPSAVFMVANDLLEQIGKVQLRPDVQCLKRLSERVDRLEDVR